MELKEIDGALESIQKVEASEFFVDSNPTKNSGCKGRTIVSSGRLDDGSYLSFAFMPECSSLFPYSINQTKVLLMY